MVVTFADPRYAVQSRMFQIFGIVLIILLTQARQAQADDTLLAKWAGIVTDSAIKANY